MEDRPVTYQVSDQWCFVDNIMNSWSWLRLWKHRFNKSNKLDYLFFLKDFLNRFLERGKGEEKERNIDVQEKH